MLVSVIISFLIIIISAAIPIIHFVAFPLSPFISGFIGASVGDLENEQIAYFGDFGMFLAKQLLFFFGGQID